MGDKNEWQTQYGKRGVTCFGSMGEYGKNWMAWYEDEDGDIKDAHYFRTREEAVAASIDLTIYCEGKQTA